MEVAGTSYSENCMICGAAKPAGHVLGMIGTLVVQDEDLERPVGRVCSNHTLWDVISHPSGRFMVEVAYDGSAD